MALPSNVSICEITGEFARAIIDGSDPDRDPDAVPLPGLVVRFTADLNPYLVRNAVSKKIIVVDPIVATTNAAGVLVGPDGQPGVRVVASDDPDIEPTGWTYRVEISGTDFPSSRFSFTAPSGATVDLAAVVPLPPSPGAQIPQWQAVVTTVTDLRTDAVAAAVEAVAAKEAVEQVIATNDGIMTAVAEDEGTAFRAALSTTIGRAVRPVGTPSFVRLNGGDPVMTQATQNPLPGKAVSDSLYWFCPFNAEEMGISNPPDKYGFVWSTNHTVGGMYLGWGPTPLGPVTSHGKIYDDPVGPNGNGQAETFVVFPDPTGEHLMRMTYQVAQAVGAVGTQSTIGAHSDDGVTWVRDGLAMDITPSTPGDGHTGYARSMPSGRAVYAYSLLSGGQVPKFALWVSYDGGKKFTFLSELSLGRDMVPDGRRIEWNTVDVFNFGGRKWATMMLSNYVSGGDTKDGRLAIAPISEDLRQVLAPPTTILYPPAAGENTDYQAQRLFVDADGAVYLYYQCGNAVYAAGLEN